MLGGYRVRSSELCTPPVAEAVSPPPDENPWIQRFFAAFVVVGTSNAVNLTDGLDGLAIGPVMINAGTYMVLAYIAGLSLADAPPPVPGCCV